MNMKRFARTYLTIVIVVAVLANLALIIIYGQHFLFQGAEVCSDVTQVCDNGFNGGSLTTQLVIVNIAISSFFGVTWMTIRHLQNIWQS